MKALRILVTAGPTREPIDPVRFISNYSTGVMGYSIADVAKKRGHKVTLISGPTSLIPPSRLKTISVITAEDMFKAVRSEAKDVDCIIMAAAVSDFRPTVYHNNKLKREDTPQTLRLKRSTDILGWLGRQRQRQLLVGFCVETGDLIKNAKKKIISKNLDMIVATTVDQGNSAFGTGKTTVVIINRTGEEAPVKKAPKLKIAHILLDKIEDLWCKRNATRVLKSLKKIQTL